MKKCETTIESPMIEPPMIESPMLESKLIGSSMIEPPEIQFLAPLADFSKDCCWRLWSICGNSLMAPLADLGIFVVGASSRCLQICCWRLWRIVGILLLAPLADSLVDVLLPHLAMFSKLGIDASGGFFETCCWTLWRMFVNLLLVPLMVFVKMTVGASGGYSEICCWRLWRIFVSLVLGQCMVWNTYMLYNVWFEVSTVFTHVRIHFGSTTKYSLQYVWSHIEKDKKLL